MKELINFEEIKAPVLFGSDDEVAAIIHQVQNSARSIVVNIETAKGRKEIASLAAKVAKSKTYLDGLGKELVSGIKIQAKEIDNRRKNIRDTFDELKEEIRKPLTDFENKEKERIAGHEEALDTLEVWLTDIPACEDVDDLIQMNNETRNLFARPWEEFTDGATRLMEKITVAYEKRKAELELAEKQAAEIELLKKEAAEREIKEREERIAREAAENARLEQEREIQAQRDREQLAIKRAEQEKIAAQQATIDAERREIEAAKQAEFDRQQAINRQKQDEKRHQEELERAAEVERKRLENIEAAKIFDAQCREADKEHRAKVNNEAMECLVNAGVSRTGAKQAITAIAKGLVEHVKIDY